MMTYDFALGVDVDGLHQRRQFSIAAPTFVAAVQKSLSQIEREQPTAKFKGLTYYHPPLGFEERP